MISSIISEGASGLHGRACTATAESRSRVGIRWCSPSLIVKKPGLNQFRMAVDIRGVNERTERMVLPMPMLAVVMEHMYGAECFFALDFLRCIGNSLWRSRIKNNSRF